MNSKFLFLNKFKGIKKLWTSVSNPCGSSYTSTHRDVVVML